VAKASLIILPCSFEDKLCLSCKKLSSADLEYQYLFEVYLQDSKELSNSQLPVVISSKYMVSIGRHMCRTPWTAD
jgi:hypothetical protein